MSCSPVGIIDSATCQTKRKGSEVVSLPFSICDLWNSSHAAATTPC